MYINPNSVDNPSLQILFIKLKNWFFFIKGYMIWIFIIAILSISGAYIYTKLKPTTYSAKTIFVVEEGKNSTSGLSGLASLAGQFGVDVGGASGSGLLSGDNILLYFKSKTLAREVLLSQFDSLSNISLADKYIEVYKLGSEWKKKLNIIDISFPPLKLNRTYSRLQDSLLQAIIFQINSSQFSVGKVDKKASFIEVSATMEDEILAKEYCERILNEGIRKYVSVKIERQKSTVEKLQSRLDSIENILNRKTASSASLQASSATLDINPLFKSRSIITTETTLRDKTMLATIYASVTQNLEFAKFSLSQETPVIQIIDLPRLPLVVTKPSILKNMFLFLIVFEFLFFIILSIKYLFVISNYNINTNLKKHTT